MKAFKGQEGVWRCTDRFRVQCAVLGVCRIWGCAVVARLWDWMVSGLGRVYTAEAAEFTCELSKARHPQKTLETLNPKPEHGRIPQEAPPLNPKPSPK